VGLLPNGRKKHRTFSIKGINPNASFESIDNFIRALAPVFAYLIMQVHKVIKRKITFYEDAALPVPQDNVAVVSETRRIIPYPVQLTARVAPDTALGLKGNRSAFHRGSVIRLHSFILGRAAPSNEDPSLYKTSSTVPIR